MSRHAVVAHQSHGGGIALVLTGAPSGCKTRKGQTRAIDLGQSNRVAIGVVHLGVAVNPIYISSYPRFES
ncbi:hypothetical protein D3C80_1785670 [compost metagenome]